MSLGGRGHNSLELRRGRGGQLGILDGQYSRLAPSDSQLIGEPGSLIKLAQGKALVGAVPYERPGLLELHREGSPLD